MKRKTLVLIAAFALSGCNGFEEYLDVLNQCETNEYDGLRSCLNTWGCDKTAKDIERFYVLEDAKEACIAEYYAAKRKGRKP